MPPGRSEHVLVARLTLIYWGCVVPLGFIVGLAQPDQMDSDGVAYWIGFQVGDGLRVIVLPVLVIGLALSLLTLGLWLLAKPRDVGPRHDV
jgi:hypothetical protein